MLVTLTTLVGGACSGSADERSGQPSADPLAWDPPGATDAPSAPTQWGVGGQHGIPTGQWWSAALTPYKGSVTQSCFVALQTRS